MQSQGPALQMSVKLAIVECLDLASKSNRIGRKMIKRVRAKQMVSPNFGALGGAAGA